MSRTPRFLVIRRDNIGDLVCTTPLLAGLRRHYPQAHIAALVNSYNCDVLAGNPDVDEIFAYTKAKHRQSGETLLGVYAQRLRMFIEMRRIGAGSASTSPFWRRRAFRRMACDLRDWPVQKKCWDSCPAGRIAFWKYR